MDRNTRAFVFVLAALALIGILAVYLSLPSGPPPSTDRAESGTTEPAPVQVERVPREELLPAVEPIDTMTLDLEIKDTEPAPPSSDHALAPRETEQTESPEGGTIQGTVTLDGAPYPNVSILVYDAEMNRLANGQTDSEGQFKIRNVPAGENRIEAAADGRQANIVIFVADNLVTPVDIPFDSPTAAFSGKVTINGEPPSHFVVRGWVYTRSGEEVFKVRGNPDGTYKSDGLLPAGDAKMWTYAYDAESKYYRRETMIRLEPGVDTITDIDFSSTAGAHGTITGTLPGGEGGVSFFPVGTPVPRTKAEFTVEAFGRTVDALVSFAYMKKDGTFDALGLEPGEYDYVAYSKMDGIEAAAYRGGNFAFGTVTITEGQSVELNVHLEPLPEE